MDLKLKNKITLVTGQAAGWDLPPPTSWQQKEP